jgi:hypothetical protein
VKEAADYPRRRPPLFIGSKTQRLKFLNSMVKNRGHVGSSWKSQEPTPGKAFSFVSILDPQILLAQVCIEVSASPSRGFCWGIQNQAFRTPNREIISVSQPQFERLSCETPGAFKSVFISQNLSFDQYPSSSVE